jgi:hypothetical protein
LKVNFCAPKTRLKISVSEMEEDRFQSSSRQANASWLQRVSARFGGRRVAPRPK